VALDKLDGWLSLPCFDLLSVLQTDTLSDSDSSLDWFLLPIRVSSPNFFLRDEVFDVADPVLDAFWGLSGFSPCPA
jgi:hypothetical protein